MKQQPLPLNTFTDMTRRWQTNAILGPEILERLYEVNLTYLNYLASDTFRSMHSARPHQAESVTVRLTKLDPALRTQLARCPFTLFTARFHDGVFWTRLTQTTSVHEPLQAFGDNGQGLHATTAFCELSLFFAWHLVNSNQSAARTVLGMNEHSLAAFKRISLTYLQYLSVAHSEVVTLRWPERAVFWQSLLNAVQRGEPDRIAEVHSLGLHMIASEL